MVCVFVPNHDESSDDLLRRCPFIPDETLWVPLTVVLPDVETGSSNSLVTLLDPGPTLAELSGVTTPDAIDRSFGPLLYAERADHWSLVTTHYRRNPGGFSGVPVSPIYVIRGRRYMPAETVGQKSILCDPDEQPTEGTNCAGDPVRYVHRSDLRN